MIGPALLFDELLHWGADMSFDMRINDVKILLRKADPGKCVLRVFRIDRSASISWRIIRLSERNLKLYQQVHCRSLFIIFGHDTRHSTIYHHVSSMNLSFTTMYHRTSNGWIMVRSTNDLELLPRTPTSAQRVSVSKDGKAFRSDSPPPVFNSLLSCGRYSACRWWTSL